MVRIYELSGDIRYLDAACEMNGYLMNLQNMKSTNKGIRGGIKGSHPVWGSYEKYRYPNWAVKFFIDALILEDKCRRLKITNK